jgi:hypothetical protein
MKYDLLIKCFIAFCVGAIIYKFISDRCSCSIVEGQNSPTPSTPSPAPGAPSPAPGAPAPGAPGAPAPGAPAPGAPAPGAPAPGAAAAGNMVSSVPIDEIQTLIDDLNNNVFKRTIKQNIDDIVTALNGTNTPISETPDSINTISSFEQFGEVPDALDYLELIVMTISKLDPTNFKKFIENLIQVSEYCSSDKDLNAHVISIILLQYYNIKLESSNKYIVISNTLSKYIPDILENIQQLNIDCNNSDKTVKSDIMDTIIYRLFKNNNTVIKIGSIDSLISELRKLPQVYGVVLMLCISYIIVRFLGMFNMKLEV